MKKIRTMLGPAVMIALVVAAVVFALDHFGKLEALELKTLDMRFALRGERKFRHDEAADSVKVIAIDAPGIKEVGRWPWPRGVIARMISGICGTGESAFEGFEDAGEGWDDAESGSGWETAEEPAEAAPDDSGAAAVAVADEQQVENAADGSDAESAKIADKATSEKQCAENSNPFEIKGVRQVVALDILFDRAERDYSPFLMRESAMMNPGDQDAMAVEAIGNCEYVVLASLLKWVGRSKDLGLGDESLHFKIKGEDIVMNRPLADYRLENVRDGLINMQPSRFDERVRKARMYYRIDDPDDVKYLFPFPIVALAGFLDVDIHDIAVVEGKSVTVGEIVIPVDKNGDIYINYRGKEYEKDENGNVSKDNIFHVMDVISDPEVFSMLAGGPAVYMAGVTDPELKDVFYTPYQQAGDAYPNNAVVSGVEIHKEVLDTILQGDYLHDADEGQSLAMIFMVCLITCVASFLAIWAGAGAGIAAGAAAWIFALGQFKCAGVIYPVVGPILAVPISLGGSVLYKNLVLNREKNAVKNIFKSYVAPHVLAELMENPDDLKLGGKKSKVSVLFSDIRGFTTISEQLQPDILIKGLNHYLGNMTDIILDSSGMIDKFIGDAVMGVWGAPLAGPSDAKNAVRAAVRMKKSLDEIRPQVLEFWGNKTGLDIQIGVGINTGEATLGNIGSAGKLDYTVIGDSVNLASRLEGLTKQYGAFLIVSESTYNEVKDDFECCLLDLVKVKGKDLPVAIYQVFCEKGALDEKTKNVLVKYNAGIEQYHKKSWTEAIAAFKEGLVVDPDNKACKLYVERCEYYSENPPPENWDGSFAWKTK